MSGGILSYGIFGGFCPGGLCPGFVRGVQSVPSADTTCSITRTGDTGHNPLTAVLTSGARHELCIGLHVVCRHDVRYSLCTAASLLCFPCFPASVVQRFGVGLVIERSLLSQLGQLSLLSLRGRKIEYEPA